MHCEHVCSLTPHAAAHTPVSAKAIQAHNKSARGICARLSACVGKWSTFSGVAVFGWKPWKHGQGECSKSLHEVGIAKATQVAAVSVSWDVNSGLHGLHLLGCYKRAARAASAGMYKKSSVTNPQAHARIQAKHEKLQGCAGSMCRR
eukprot:363029-Chlamydomonas_euryale.AAC.10